MYQRSLLGWLLAGAFCASVSCSGGHNGAAPPGFGVPCTTDKACATYTLVCGSDDKCVQCTGDSLCKSGQVCRAGLCATPQDCKTSRDCPDDQICDKDAELCVECVSSSDCKTGQKCDADNTCTDRPSCEFTSDCDDGLVCEPERGLCVTCRDTDDCGLRMDCVDFECVKRATTGTGGKSGTGTGGSATAGSGTGGSDVSGGFAGRGGTNATGGRGGSGGGGRGGTGGASGTGGSVSNPCGCLIGEVCTEDLRCVSPQLIDDFFDCDDQILAIEGRSGIWAADADTGIELEANIGSPEGVFDDSSCAAWATGTELTVDDPDATFAFVGFMLNQEATYDLSSYDGVGILLEAPDTAVQVVLKTSGGGYFQYTLDPTSVTGSDVRKADFVDMVAMENSAEAFLDLSTVTEVQFSVTTPASFAFAVHGVALY